jgi:hypothetical protein
MLVEVITTACFWMIAVGYFDTTSGVTNQTTPVVSPNKQRAVTADPNKITTKNLDLVDIAE